VTTSRKTLLAALALVLPAAAFVALPASAASTTLHHKKPHHTSVHKVSAHKHITHSKKKHPAS
jgi:hypothetical protein